MEKRLYRLAVLLLTLVMLGSGGYILWKNLDYQKGARHYEAAARTAGLPRLIKPPKEAPGASWEGGDPYISALAEVDLDALQAVNGDVVGWIMIPDTELSYPVLHGRDNSYYLNHTWMRERNAVGAIFMEHKCAPDFSDFNTILYGHRMNNESMFGILHGYQREDFWREHPAVYVVTDSAIQVYDVYAACEVGVEEIVYRQDIRETGREQAFLDFSLERSVIETGVVPTPEDQVLVLSTCTGRGHATRWVVQAVLREACAR